MQVCGIYFLLSHATLIPFKSLLETVKKSELRSQRDNDLIYHQDVPSPSALVPIQETRLVSSTTPKGLLNPESMIGTRHQLFSQLAGWGAREAISEFIIFASKGQSSVGVDRHLQSQEAESHSRKDP